MGLWLYCYGKFLACGYVRLCMHNIWHVDTWNFRIFVWFWSFMHVTNLNMQLNTLVSVGRYFFFSSSLRFSWMWVKIISNTIHTSKLNFNIFILHVHVHVHIHALRYESSARFRSARTKPFLKVLYYIHFVAATICIATTDCRERT